MPAADRLLLHERHLVSKELAGLDEAAAAARGAAVVVGDRGVMVNEEDHLRLQAMRSGFALPDAYARTGRRSASWDRGCPLPSTPNLAFLRPVRRMSGTGMRASVLIHLPGLVLTKEIGKVLRGCSRWG